MQDMTDDAFWEIIGRTLRPKRSKQLVALRKQLRKMSPDEIYAFDDAYRRQLERAYHWDLWGAAYVLMGGCSDDMFDYFCDWLISRGQKVFEAALADPESLADVVVSDNLDFEVLRYEMGNAYQELTGKEMPDPKSGPGEVQGEPFDEDTVDDRFPRLAALELDDDDDDDDEGWVHPSWAQSLADEPKFEEVDEAEFFARIESAIGKIVTGFTLGDKFLNAGTNLAIWLDDDLALLPDSYELELSSGEMLSATQHGPAHLKAERVRIECNRLYAAGEPYDDLSEQFEKLYEISNECHRRDEAIADRIAPYFDVGKTQITVRSIERLKGCSLRMTFSNLPECRALTLFGYDGDDDGSPGGIDVMSPTHHLRWSPPRAHMRVDPSGGFWCDKLSWFGIGAGRNRFLI